MPPLNPEQIELQLKSVPDWRQQAQTLCRVFKFEGFLMSIAFVRRVAKRAEKLQHHPDIDIRFDKVTLTLTTHDAGGITEKDFELARQCDVVFAKFLESWSTEIHSQNSKPTREFKLHEHTHP